MKNLPYIMVCSLLMTFDVFSQVYTNEINVIKTPQAGLHINTTIGPEIIRVQSILSPGQSYLSFYNNLGYLGYLGYGSSSNDDFLINNSKSSNLRIYNNGSERIRIDPNGHIGIATISPGYLLDVNGAGGSNIELFVNGRMKSGGSNAGFWADNVFFGKTGSNLGLYNSGWHIQLKSDGKVGIGTSSPQDKLHIWEGGTNAYSGIRFNPGSDYNHYAYLRVLKYKPSGLIVKVENQDSGRGNAGIILNTSQGSSYNNSKISLIANQLYIRTGISYTDKISGNSYGNTAIYIANDQKVGIGTTIPSHLLSVNGTAGKSGGGSWEVFSDERLKTNIVNFSDGLNILASIRPVRYNYNGKYNLPIDQEFIGVVAQEIQEIAPYMVKTLDGDEQYLTVDPSAFDFILINAVKEQQEKIEELKKLNEQQENEYLQLISDLSERISELEMKIEK